MLGPAHLGGAWQRGVGEGWGPPFASLPSPVDQTATCRLWGRELGQQPQAAPGWLLGLALLKARAVNSALLKMSNKGQKERKEKGKWGEPGGSWGGKGRENRWGLFKQKA